MLLALPFPNVDPVLLQLGPFAIRWYALAYIAGILLGWLYARAIIRTQRLWGGPAPMTATDFDDFIVWVTLGIILGGRIGYVLFYNPAYFAAHPLEALELWKGGMSFHGGFTGCVARGGAVREEAAAFRCCRSATSPARSGRSACFSGGSRTSSTANCGAARRDVPWAMVFPTGGPLPRHPSQLYEAALEGLGAAAACLRCCIRAGALKRPGLIIGALRDRLCDRALVLRAVPRAGRAARLPVGRRSPWAWCCRCRCCCSASC